MEESACKDEAAKLIAKVIWIIENLNDSPKSMLSNLQSGLPHLQAWLNEYKNNKA